MSQITNHPTAGACQLNCYSTVTLDYESLYSILKQHVPTWVYSYRVPSWKGQESDVVDDVIQVGVTRTWNYVGRAERGEVAPIESVERLCITITQNYCRDLRRKEIRLVRPDVDNRDFMDFVNRAGGVDAADVVAEKIDNEGLFGDVSFAVVRFPAKQRTALCTDLAHLMHFDDEPTPLQRAFLRYGVQLQNYQGCKPVDARGRNHHSTYLCLGYQRLKRIFQTSS